MHLHEVRDTDTHFIIDPITRAIKNANSAKNTLMLGDHNSEVFTFQIPKEVEGHDMSLCNKVEVHYIDISADKANKSADVYKVKNMRVDDKQSDTLVFSWLISGNATKYAGVMNFRIRFACVDEDGIYTYKWHTDIYKGITISDGFDNTAAVIEEYSDIIAAWERRIIALEEGSTGSTEDIREAVDAYLKENPVIAPSGLPQISEDDEGKVLTAVGGEWKAEPVTIPYNEVTNTAGGITANIG